MRIAGFVYAFTAVALLSGHKSAAQNTWILPTPIQSSAEQAATAPTEGQTQGQTQGVGWVLPGAATAPRRAPAVAPTRPALTYDAAGHARITPTDRPNQPLFAPGTAVTTGFSGTKTRLPRVVRDAPEPDLSDPRYHFLDPDGVVASLVQVDDVGHAFNGAELQRGPYDVLRARDVGQVFGIAVDNDDFRNLYLTATSAFGLNIVGGVLPDGLPQRLRSGAPDARWMAGQWGPHPQAGPGSVWRVDGETGQIRLLTNITLDGRANSGPGLGNIAYDPAHDQLFVSDLETGMVHRLTLVGQDLEQFDHGQTDAAGAQGRMVAHDPEHRADITRPEFDVEDPETWGFAAPERRVWGLTVRAGRLYYAVASGPSVFSVGLDPETGAFLDDARWELTVEGTRSDAEITDMAFAGNGGLILAQRGETLGAFDYRRLTRPRRAEVLRYVREDPDDPASAATPSDWVAQPLSYPIGFAQPYSNALGGVALSPRYDTSGKWDDRYCGATIWGTGEDLRENARLQKALELGGNLRVDGVQAQPLVQGPTGNAPPWETYFNDYDGKHDGPNVTGHVGDVEILGCRASPGGEGDYAAFDEREDPKCQQAPWLCKPVPSCLNVTAVAICDRSIGEYVITSAATDALGNGLDRVKISEPAGALAGFPQDTTLPGGVIASLRGLAPGQPTQLDFCGYRSAEAQAGTPYSCCRATVSVTMPAEACEKEAN